MFKRKTLESNLALLIAILVCQVIYTNATSFKDDVSLTKQQSSNLQKFKRRMLSRLDQDFMKDDLFLLRFLRARNYDVRKAEEFLLGHLKWRKEFKMDTIRDEDWSDFEADYPYNIAAVDKEGRPVLQWDLGEWDLRKQIVAGKTHRLNRYTAKMFDDTFMKVYEYQLEQKNVTRWTIMIDLNNLNAAQHVNPSCLPYYMTTSITYEAQYPGLGNNIYLINTPELFESVLTLTRPVLSAHTRNGLKVYGKNEKEWGPVLRAEAEADQLPPRFGGTKVVA